MNDLKTLIEYIAVKLVGDQSKVRVDASQHGQVVIVRLTVPSEEMGKVIGRQGRIARAMRTVLTIAASRRGLRASLDIND
ncbi:KH domain-containing protein [Nitrolancea hollandica]|uniref:RNA-binding protein KhpA n=1 Tax=Nitrolancea hollandica Lb TaxID=1129897 RepID=I4ECU1_9BACT|nr:KH domain-containing protein [Nitrolancea hollandica]CCF82503.1 conserved hypothetical protein [Nitrolancea hollandica Lb]